MKQAINADSGQHFLERTSQIDQFDVEATIPQDDSLTQILSLSLTVDETCHPEIKFCQPPPVSQIIHRDQHLFRRAIHRRQMTEYVYGAHRFRFTFILKHHDDVRLYTKI